jgi:hypothetical protein
MLSMFFVLAGCRAEGQGCDAAPMGIVTCGVGLACLSVSSCAQLIDCSGTCHTRCRSDADCPPNLHCANVYLEDVCWD